MSWRISPSRSLYIKLLGVSASVSPAAWPDAEGAAWPDAGGATGDGAWGGRGACDDGGADANGAAADDDDKAADAVPSAEVPDGEESCAGNCASATRAGLIRSLRWRGCCGCCSSGRGAVVCGGGGMSENEASGDGCTGDVPAVDAPAGVIGSEVDVPGIGAPGGDEPWDRGDFVDRELAPCRRDPAVLSSVAERTMVPRLKADGAVSGEVAGGLPTFTTAVAGWNGCACCGGFTGDFC